ncbi:hypothetical protein [Microtetraspora malaysiensis]|uniref:hypothetical protein n=1 Tax=Microtetraspora malaysiensis TaxID=161358 RepID=UPI003D934D5A
MSRRQMVAGLGALAVPLAQPQSFMKTFAPPGAAAYARALRDHPNVRLLLLSHMNNRTGLVLALAVRDVARRFSA